MISKFAQVWDDLLSDSHQSGHVYRRVLPSFQQDVYFGREKPSNRRRVDISVEEVLVGESTTNSIASAGIALTVQYKTEKSASLTLAELTPSDSPQFDDLVADLLTNLINRPGDGAIARMISRTKAWFRFFTITGTGIGPSVAAGLFAELCVIQSLLERGLPPEATVGSWVGPDDAVQDFNFEGGALEVKSDRTSGPGKLAISSELQLDTSAVDHLVVALFQLDHRTDGSGATLPEIARKCLQLMESDQAACIDFQTKLIAMGMSINAPDHSHRFTVRRSRFYDVSSGFPKLTPENIPIGIKSVNYAIECSSLTSYEISDEDAFSLLGV